MYKLLKSNAIKFYGAIILFLFCFVISMPAQIRATKEITLEIPNGGYPIVSNLLDLDSFDFEISASTPNADEITIRVIEGEIYGDGTSGNFGGKQGLGGINFSNNGNVKEGGSPRWTIYVDEEMADEIGLNQNERKEVERIIDHYKKQMDQINLNNATVSALSDNKFVIKISKAEEQGREVTNLLFKEILIGIGGEKLNRFMEFDKNKISSYFHGFGQSARTLEIEIKTKTIQKESGEVFVFGKIAEIKDAFEHFGFWKGSRLPIGRLGNYEAFSTLIEGSD